MAVLYHGHGDGNSSLDFYLREIGEISLLKPEEEFKLARRVRLSKDPEAIECLIDANLRFVVFVAKKFRDRGLPMEDLISEGNIGLVNAAKGFDERRGYRFISYAIWHIKQRILKAIAEQSRMIRLPLNQVSNSNQIKNTSGPLGQRLGHNPSAEEIAEALGLSSEEVSDTLEIAQPHLSLDVSFSPGEGDTLLKVISDEKCEPPDENLEKKELSSLIENALNNLTPREAKIISLWFGLSGGEPLSLEEIGEIFSLTRERIRQIKDEAIKRLGKNPSLREWVIDGSSTDLVRKGARSTKPVEAVSSKPSNSERKRGAKIIRFDRRLIDGSYRRKRELPPELEKDRVSLAKLAEEHDSIPAQPDMIKLYYGLLPGLKPMTTKRVSIVCGCGDQRSSYVYYYVRGKLENSILLDELNKFRKRVVDFDNTLGCL